MSKRILIADDSKIIRQFVRTYLENRLDFVACSEAEDGRDAMQRAAEVKPDLILLDFRMPRMNGLEAAAILHAGLPTVPIILYTLHKDIVARTHTESIGIRAVVSKTDPIEVLLGEVLNFVGVARTVTA